MRVRVQEPATGFRGIFICHSNGFLSRSALAVLLFGVVLWCAGCGFTPAASVSLRAASAALETNPSSLNFGSVMVGGVSTRAITLSSDGTAPVTVTSATVKGSGFSVTGASFPLTLAEGQSKTLEVKFDPAAPGNAASTLTLATDASTGSQTTVALSGSGQPAGTAAAYSVDLNWEQPSSANTPIMGYYIYRTASNGVTYQQLNATLETALSFTDDSVEPGNTYTYYVASVASSGLESAPSNSITLKIP